MAAIYNEIDAKTAAWLRELINQGQITEGEVNERSITDLSAADVAGFQRVHLFAGIGGWDYALKLAGWPDDRPVWTGSCPCQPFSAAGKQRGTEDKRHLWPHMFRLIRECRPVTIFGEQVASKLALRWLDRVCADLEQEGYACGASDICAAGVNLPQVRQRIFWCANLDCGAGNGKGKAYRQAQVETGRGFRQSDETRVRRFDQLVVMGLTQGPYSYAEARRIFHGIPARVESLRGYGNAIVPQVAAEFVRAFMEVEEGGCES